MKRSTSAAPVLSPVKGKPILLNFDGAEMSSDAGLTLLREVERRHDLAGRLASCLTDLRDPEKVRHSLEELIRFRMLMVSAGYEDGNDAANLRHDPSFKIALERNPETGAALCSQHTISRMENLPGIRDLIRMGREMVRFYCQSFKRVPGLIVLDIDDTFDAVHGHQQLRLFNSYNDEYGFQPIVVFDGDGRLVEALLRPARRPKGTESAAYLRRLIREIRKHLPKTEILLRADSHYCTPEVLDLCGKLGLRYVFGLSRNSRLHEQVQALEGCDDSPLHGQWWPERPAVQCIRLCGRVLVKSPPRSGPGRGQLPGAGHPLHRDQSRRRARQASLREGLFCPRSGREPHQGMEDPSRLGPHLLYQGVCQSDAAHTAWLCLLDLVEPPRGLSEAIPMAACPV